MPKRLEHLVIVFILGAVAALSGAQEKPVPPPAVADDNSKESAIVQSMRVAVRYENDGTATREHTFQVRLQSEAGVQQYGLLAFGYSSANEQIEISYVRVRKPDGTEIATPLNDIQDMPSDITRAAPMYSDYREKHVAVKGLGIGDVLEYDVKTRLLHALIPGQFWFDYAFEKDAIVLDEELELNLPQDRYVNVKSTVLKPTEREENGRHLYLWKTSNTKRKSADEDAAPATPPPPPVQVTTFRTWDEVGKWWGGLEQERVTPTADIRAKAAEITRDAKTDAEKVKAIYHYVATRFRYIGVSFGIGRYQPHAAEEVLNNAYGDCKDKHTLLASLLQAAGIVAYPALINSALKIDPEVPSPGHFNHVISVVPQGKDWIWLDTTTEVAPFAFLMANLRDKEALVIPTDKPASLVKTPPDPPFMSSVTFQVDGTLDDAGTLKAKIERTDRGDTEVIFRLAFRQTPQSSWKDLVQKISYASGFAGDVSDVTVSSPEATDGPFRVSYQYDRKEYSDWGNHRISPPVQICTFSQLSDKAVKSSEPLKLSGPAEYDCQARISIPQGYNAQLLPAADINRDFAEYHSAYSFQNGVFEAKRHIVIKMRELPATRREDFHSLQKAASDDGDRYTTFGKGDEMAMESPSNPEAASLLQQARDASLQGDYKEALRLTQRAVDLDPNFKGGWLALGGLRIMQKQTDEGLEAFHKVIDLDPRDRRGYQALASAQLVTHRPEQAIQVWRDFLKQYPDDFEARSNIAGLLFGARKFSEAIPEFEAAIALDPKNMGLQMDLGRSYLEVGSNDKALALLKKTADSSLKPVLWNDVAYYLADRNVGLEEAQRLAEMAVHSVEGDAAQIKLENLKTEDLQLMPSLSSFWDTLGWVYFRQGETAKAEKYLGAAWALMQSQIIGEHLAQVYEKQGKKEAATHQLILARAFSGSASNEHTLPLRRRDGSYVSPEAGRRSALEELSQMRRVKLGKLPCKPGSAEFWVLFAAGGKVIDVKFISGADDLRSQGKAIASAKIVEPNPNDSPTRIVRRGVMVCMSMGLGCDFTIFTLDSVQSLN